MPFAIIARNWITWSYLWIFNVCLWYLSDVTGVEITGALKNVLAIAAGIVEGMSLGNNCMAALVAQGCSEIRWLATKVHYYLIYFPVEASCSCQVES